MGIETCVNSVDGGLDMKARQKIQSNIKGDTVYLCSCEEIAQEIRRRGGKI